MTEPLRKRTAPTWLTLVLLTVGTASCHAPSKHDAPSNGDEPLAEAESERTDAVDREEPLVGSSDPVPAVPEPAAATATAEPAAAKSDSLILEFEQEIDAPVETVWAAMLGKRGYSKWTAPFMDGSYYEGSWGEGERMKFLAPGGNGMVAEIAEYREYELVSIRHLGYAFGGVEDTTSPAVRAWAPAYENYRFERRGDQTLVKIEHEVLRGFEAYMRKTWPAALATLAELCEAGDEGTDRP